MAGTSTQVRWEWFISRYMAKLNKSLRARVTLATTHLKTEVVKNISKPVTVTTGPRGGRKVSGRSKRGEFPRAETYNLARSIFAEVRGSGDQVHGTVSTPEDYGLILETTMDRSFLLRTLIEQKPMIKKIITGKRLL